MSVCLSLHLRTVQRKCCSGSLRESKCLAGLRAALAGQACEVDGDGICGADSYKASTVASFERAGRYGRRRRDSVLRGPLIRLAYLI